MTKVSIETLAQEIKTPVETLLQQFADAGIMAARNICWFANE
jgi:Translation initiation factor IF-2, N-terminal region.